LFTLSLHVLENQAKVMIKKLSIALVIFLTSYLGSMAQTVVAFQGGEGTAADNWSYLTIANNSTSFPPGPGAYGTLVRTGTKSIRLAGAQPSNCTLGTNCATGTVGGEGCSLMNGKTLEFNSVNIGCYENVQLKAYTSSHLGACNGAGFDNTDYLYYEVRLNGGSWQTIDTLQGDNNNTWIFSMTSIGGLNTAPNPFVYNVPAGTTSFAFRIRGVTNRSDEFFYVDDVSLTTTTTGYGGTAGLWTGKVNTNWNNPCNWFNATIPTNITTVNIPDTSINFCEVLAGNNAVCAALNVNDTLKVENPSSTLTVNGAFTLQANGFLDLSSNSTSGGNMTLTGNWFNQRTDAYFEEAGSKVLFNGSSTQTIQVNGTNGDKEVFSVLEINKTSTRTIPYDDIHVDPNNLRGNIPVLILTSGVFDFRSIKKELLVGNPFSGAVSRVAGGVCLEDTINRTKFTRAVDPSQGTYLFPICNYTTTVLAANQYIPVTISNLSGGPGSITLSAYNTPATNLPWPSTPVSVNNLASFFGLSPDNRDATADRFWNFSSSVPLSGNITFTYNNLLELPISPYNDPLQLKAQYYDDNTESWQPYLPGQTAGNYFVTVPSTAIDFTWALSSTPSPLPVELLYFSALAKDHHEVNLLWETATEINSWKFEVERSSDGVTFEKIITTPAAGNSTTPISYLQTDRNPLPGISYYRLIETDFDGKTQTSQVVSINLDGKNAGQPLQVFPNPASHEVYILGLQSSSFIELYDFKGDLMSRRSTENNNEIFKIDLSTYPKGMYFLKDSYGNSQKLLVQ
jgi:hypothetical protein